MGEYAEMMLDGTCCEGCGSYIGDGDGYPRYCSSECAAGRGVVLPFPKQRRIGKPKAKCPECGRKVKAVGLWQHIRDVHRPAKAKGGAT